jgi:hypothetical protein
MGGATDPEVTTDHAFDKTLDREVVKAAVLEVADPVEV